MVVGGKGCDAVVVDTNGMVHYQKAKLIIPLVKSIHSFLFFGLLNGYYQHAFLDRMIITFHMFLLHMNFQMKKASLHQESLSSYMHCHAH